MAEYAIDKDVPIPKSGRGRRNMYPLSEMEIGDSFFVPLGDEPVRKLESRVSNACTHAKKSGKGTFTIRSIDGGIRVWRIA